MSSQSCNVQGKETHPVKKSINWSNLMKDILINTYYEYAVAGKTKPNQKVIEEVSKKIGVTVTSDNIRTCLKTIKKHFATVDHAANASGFNFNYTTFVVEADDDAWNSYVESYPEAKDVRIKSFPYYEKLGVIYGGQHAIGGRQEAGDDLSDGTQGTNIGQEDVINLDDDETFNANYLTQRAPNAARNKRKRNSGSSDSFTEAAKVLAQAAKSLAEAFQTPSIRGIEDALGAIPDLSVVERDNAMDLMTEKTELIKLFWEISEASRGSWIKRKLSRG